MSENVPAAEQRDEDERIPWQQTVFDDLFLMIAAGLVFPTLVYIVWGLWALANVEMFQP